LGLRNPRKKERPKTKIWLVQSKSKLAKVKGEVNSTSKRPFDEEKGIFDGRFFYEIFSRWQISCHIANVEFEDIQVYHLFY